MARKKEKLWMVTTLPLMFHTRLQRLLLSILSLLHLLWLRLQMFFSSHDTKNIFGQNVRVQEMESRAVLQVQFTAHFQPVL